MDLFFVKTMIIKFCFHDFGVANNIKNAYYHVIIMWVYLKRKHGLLYNCLHVSQNLRWSKS